MNNKIYSLIIATLLAFQGFAQNRCGQQIMIAEMAKTNPGIISSFAKAKKNAAMLGAKYASEKSTLSTTGSAIIPVVFHIVLDSNQFKAIGGIAGIESRVNSQMKVINDDFNGNNADKTNVPSVWNSLFANVGINFGLARVDPSANYSPGYTLKIVSIGTSYSSADGGKAVKFDASAGVSAWDNNKYLNIWVCNFGSVFGIAAPPGLPDFTKPETGIVLHYRAFGSRQTISDDYIKDIDKGRTLTHELGHFFHIWHIWGETDACDDDDDISDTPLQAKATTGSPNATTDFPKLDACSPTGNGIMYMNYMDYVNDASMFMFTKGQANVMNAQLTILGTSYSLTLNPGLGIKETNTQVSFDIYPNPSQGVFNITFNENNNKLIRVEVSNILGQRISFHSLQSSNSIDLSEQSKGIYFVHCYFENGIKTQKIILE